MDFSRISIAIDVALLATKTVTIVGAAPRLAANLARSGVERFILIDFDRVSASNVPRQGFQQQDTGLLKVEAVAAMIRQINSEAQITCLPLDFTTLGEQDLRRRLRQTDLFLFCTDSFAAQSRGNQVALQLGIPALWVGLYAGGRAAELIFWHPELPSCFACLTAKRRAAHVKAAAEGRSLDIASAGATIFDIDLVDAIAGTLAVGLLTRGSENRFGRLIGQLGSRNFLQVKIDPTYSWNGRDLFREQLHVPADCPAYFSFVTIAREDPDGGEPPCEDCVRYRGRMQRRQ